MEGFIPIPYDVYQKRQDSRRENTKKKYPRGASTIVGYAASSVICGDGAEGLAHAYKEAVEDVNHFKRKGERDRAEIRRQQYMDEHFIPAIEIVVNYTTPDEVLNAKKALAELDKYALVEGSGKGYTASYIREAYKDLLGQVEGRSEDSVRFDVMKLNHLLDKGDIRTAYSLASKLKKQIDDGDVLASDEDYDLVGRVVAYYG